MSVFTHSELDYFRAQQIVRFATTDTRGRPQVRPVGFFYDPDSDAIVVGGVAGSGFADSAKFRNAAATGRVAGGGRCRDRQRLATPRRGDPRRR